MGIKRITAANENLTSGRSRTEAQQYWAESHGKLIANNPGYAPAIPPGRTLRVVPTLSRDMPPPDRLAAAMASYPSEASRVLVLTASFYQRFLEHPGQQPERARFVSDLLEGRAGFDVAARFRQAGWRRPPAEFVDPEIVILVKR